MTKNRLQRLLAILLLGSAISGCAVTQTENRLTMNYLDRAMEGSTITNSTTGKALAAPIALPVGLTAGVIDMALVTPARAASPAAKDTYSYLWESPQGSDLRQAMLILPKVTATPIVFLTDWAFRSVFTINFD
ncbi:MAG: hypothetical protein HXX17_12110 [Geobacteraceae bacterium]|nr:hypothetical protein [Geobacteraceae bacterium]